MWFSSKTLMARGKRRSWQSGLVCSTRSVMGVSREQEPSWGSEGGATNRPFARPSPLSGVTSARSWGRSPRYWVEGVADGY